MTDLAAGRRTIRFVGEGAGHPLLTIAPAAAPRVDLPIQQQNLGATIVSSLGGSAKILTTLQKANALVDGKPAGKIETAGVDLTNLAPGAHELVVTAQGISHRLSFNAGPAPAMAIFFGAGRNQGAPTGKRALPSTSTVRETRRATQNGRLVLYLEPKAYKIRGESRVQPVAEQSVEIQQGRSERRSDGATTPNRLACAKSAGRAVALDGAPVGTVRGRDLPARRSARQPHARHEGFGRP